MGDTMQKGKKQIAVYFTLFAVSLAFYLVWYLMDGIVITEDASSYIQMQSDREPGYCLYLFVFRALFGAESGLHAAVIGQCVIAALAACAITAGLTDLFSLGPFGSIGILMIQYGITLLNRFVAQRRYSYFNSIETEGLAYSLWVFWVLGILGILYKKDRKSLISAVVLSMVLICIRKQMVITLVILLLVVLFAYMGSKGWKTACICACLTCAISFAGTKLVDCGYNLMLRGEFAPHTGDSSFILGTELYLADDGMADCLSDDADRELFLEIRRRAEENEYNIAYAGKGWQALEEHYSSSYDRIKFDIVMPVIRENQDKRGIPDQDRETDYNRIAGTMMEALLTPTLPRMAGLYFSNVIHGMITTVLKVNRMLNPVAVFLYLCYAGNMIWLSLQRRKQAVRDVANPIPFALLVLLAIVVNVCFTSLTIYCQMRYMLYNTGLFYQAWWVMFLHSVKRVQTGIGESV